LGDLNRNHAWFDFFGERKRHRQQAMLVVRADAGLVDLRAEPELAEVIRRFELAMYIGPRGALLLRGLDREDVLLHRDGNFFF